MPETTSLPYVKPVDLEREPFHFSSDPLQEYYAIELVRRNFEWAQAKRVQRHDDRWKEADDLYFGNVPQRKWSGTQIDRSAIPNNIAYDHVEAAQGRVEAAFLDDPDLFGVEPTADSTPQDAKDVEEYFLAQLDTIPDDFSCNTAAAEMRQSWHQMLQYGEGFGELVYGKDGLHVKFLDLRDVYVDPQCSGPDIDKARWLIVSRWLTIADLQALRKDPHYNIPSDEILWTLAGHGTVTGGETTKQYSAASRGESRDPNATAPNVNPMQALLQLKCYYDNQRVIWTLADNVCVMNRENPYGFKQFLAVPCTLVPGALYGLGLPEATKWPQRYSEAFLNNMLDNCHLDMDAPIVTGRDVEDSETRMRPGLRMKADDPKKVVFFQTKGLSLQAMPLIERLEAMGARRNASPDAFSGDVRPGRVRTAAGVQAQMGSSETKLGNIVRNIEDFWFAPLLKKAFLMIRAHTLPGDILLGKYADPAQGGRQITAAAFHKPVKFVMQAGARLARRQRAQQMLPFISSAFLNQGVQQGLADSGQSFNWKDYSAMAQDAIGKSYTFVVPMSEEEKQHRNTPPPEFVAEQQAKERADQIKVHMGDLGVQREQIKAQAQLQVAQIAKQPDPYAGQEAQLKVYLAQEQARQKIQQKQEELKAKREEQAINLQTIQQKARMQQVQDAQKLGMEQQKMQMEGQRMNLEHENEVRRMMLDAQRQSMGLNQPQGPAGSDTKE